MTHDDRIQGASNSGVWFWPADSANMPMGLLSLRVWHSLATRKIASQAELVAFSILSDRSWTAAADHSSVAFLNSPGGHSADEVPSRRCERAFSSAALFPADRAATAEEGIPSASSRCAGLCDFAYGDRKETQWREKREKREKGGAKPWMTRGSTAAKKQAGTWGKRKKTFDAATNEQKFDVYDSRRYRLDKEPENVTASDDLFELTGLDVKGAGRAPRPFSAPQNPLSQPFSRPSLQAFNAVKPEHLKTVDAHFAEWFIGITESQSPHCFKKTEEGYRFGLHHTNIPMHYKIRDNLKFGKVDTVNGEWYVEQPEGIVRVFSLLNGNIFNEANRESFREWFEGFKESWDSEQKQDLKVDMTCTWRPQLNNKWLMGFIDSSIGMFAGRLLEMNQPPYFDIDLKFWVLHKDKALLEHLKTMFNGGVVKKDEGVDMYEWTAYNYKLHVKIKRYCRMFKPLSQKNVNIMRYIRLVEYPTERVKTNRSWVKIQRLVDSMNKDERKWSVTMVKHPYHDIYKENVKKQIEVARQGGSKADVEDAQKDCDEKLKNWDIHGRAPQPKAQI
ncbi:hypothetical protein BSKO_00238 [Bryopsis sp. KO-2023]|nr:hypothetical protein BSKO_00238 [Bryopsis sp. KO-2023]